jgi:hypothetical protein
MGLNSKMVDKQNVGNAGEYYVSALLSARNFVVTITLGRNIGYDLLVVNTKGHPFKISVKTANSDNNKYFLLSEKNELMEENDLFYAFVRTNFFQSLPEVWIVPSKVVAKYIAESHQKWLAEKETHNENTMRGFYVIANRYSPADWQETVDQFKNNIKILEDYNGNK